VPKGADRAIFVPGNHDWDNSGSSGQRAIQDQAAFIQAASGGRAELSPRAGCPGPEKFDLSPRLRLIAIDTQWWLHRHEKATSECFPGADDEPAVRTAFLAKLDELLASAEDRHVVLVSHHPMLSSGSHGGYHPNYRFLGGLYERIRALFSHGQDMDGVEYQEMRRELNRVMSRHRPLLYAGGHEHTQELLLGYSARFFAVSGTGIFDHETPTTVRDQTLFKHAAAGFMRLDIMDDGRAWLTVLEVDAQGAPEAAHAQELR
jgi:hypothetical protein